MEKNTLSQSSRSRVLIVGSGPSAITTAISVVDAGVEDVRLITADADFGGTWYQQTYPGCAVGAEFFLYQFSYERSVEWTHLYAHQPEILAYLQGVARKHGLYERTDFGAELLDAVWIEDDACWSVRTANAVYTADVLVTATGALGKPIIPDIPGIDTFQGRLFHSSDWPEGYTGRGDRVAIVGSGASTFQIVPAIVSDTEAIAVFQRTPRWVKPQGQRVISEAERTALRESPQLFAREYEKYFHEWEHVIGTIVLEDPSRLSEFEKPAREFLEQEIPDPELRRVLTPKEPFGCKDWVNSDDYYESLRAENVELVPEAASEITPTSVKSASGGEFKADTIVLATGVRNGTGILDRIHRRDGRTISDAQTGHPRAYKSISISGCPNLFVLAGPNGQNWNGIVNGELGAAYVVRALEYMHDNNIRALEVDEHAESEWKREADERLALGVLVARGCDGAIHDDLGGNATTWPGTLSHMMETLGTFDPDAYHEVQPTRSA